MNPRNAAKLLLPPIFISCGRIILNPWGGRGLYGDSSSWNKAVADSIGYDLELIPEKTKTALSKVKNGEAIYERDSVILNGVQYALPHLADLMLVAAQIIKRNLDYCKLFDSDHLSHPRIFFKFTE